MQNIWLTPIFRSSHLLRTCRNIKHILFLIMTYCRIPGLLLFSAALQSTFLPAALHHPIPLTILQRKEGVSINENIILSLLYLSLHFISCQFVLQNQFVFKMLLYMFSMFRYLLKIFPLLKYIQLYLFSAPGIFELSKCF